MTRRSHHPIRRHVRPRHPEGRRPGTPTDLPEGAEPVGAEPIESATVVEPVESATVVDAAVEPEPEIATDAAVAVAPDAAPDAIEPDAEELAGPVEEPESVLTALPADPPAPAPRPEAPTASAPAIPPASAPTIETERPPAQVERPAGEAVAHTAEPGAHVSVPVGPSGAATAPQLRRFIKSRSYIPMHELRRRFGIVVEDDDVAQIDLGTHRVYVGLPRREGDLLGELLRAGDVGYSVSFDPVTPVIVGVFPIRPVTRG